MKDRILLRFGFVLAVAMVAPLAIAQTAPPANKLDEKAKDAVLALKKLQSRAEIGVDYHDYSSALADTYFTVKMFLESEPAKTVPEFTEALRESIRSYKTAGDVWQAMQSSNPAEKAGAFLCDYDNGVALCKAHPELVVWYTAKASGIAISRTELLEKAATKLNEADKYLKLHQ